MRLLFGGPSLPEGKHTWYDHVNPDGTYGGQVEVRHGDVVDADRVCKAGERVEETPNPSWTKDSEPWVPETIHQVVRHYVPAAQDYVDRGMASFVED